MCQIPSSFPPHTCNFLGKWASVTKSKGEKKDVIWRGHAFPCHSNSHAWVSNKYSIMNGALNATNFALKKGSKILPLCCSAVSVEPCWFNVMEDPDLTLNGNTSRGKEGWNSRELIAAFHKKGSEFDLHGLSDHWLLEPGGIPENIGLLFTFLSWALAAPQTFSSPYCSASLLKHMKPNHCVTPPASARGKWEQPVRALMEQSSIGVPSLNALQKVQSMFHSCMTPFLLAP